MNMNAADSDPVPIVCIFLIVNSRGHNRVWANSPNMAPDINRSNVVDSRIATCAI